MAGERVLVVDDSLVYRDLLVNHVLTPNEYVPLTAKDGDEGYRVALDEAPDLIIMDMQMPGMTGIQVLEALHEAGSEIPVIMMTLHGSEDLAVRAFRLGVKDYVIKPFDIEEMLMVMDRALTEVRLRHERDALTQELIEVNRTLKAERRQLEAVLTSTTDGVLVVGDHAEERIILANDTARRDFCMRGDVVGEPLREVLEDEILVDVIQRAKETGETAHAEVPLSDDERTLNVNVTPIPGVGRVAMMQDISYLKELDRMKSEFVSTVSHDLRSPLTSIKGFANLMPSVGTLNEQQIYFLEKIQSGVETVTTMIGDLLDLGRIEAEVRMEMQSCDVRALIERVVEGQQNHAELKRQTLQVEMPPQIPSVLGNALRLGQALSNLLSNAIKYTPEGGDISISVGRENGQVIIIIEDDGIGISQEDLPHIFDKFYRVDSPETEGIIGSGLGLSIVKTIVEKHSGRIWVESQLGKGTTFTIMFPAVTQ
ncbi:MAG TPA: hybrid sensor histidine kinase/response regulator [Chloroflexi bacterium]|nr:hybrid sensor histidine kinase/response regulator [Chloroflexota bacterium]